MVERRLSICFTLAYSAICNVCVLLAKQLNVTSSKDINRTLKSNMHFCFEALDASNAWVKESINDCLYHAYNLLINST